MLQRDYISRVIEEMSAIPARIKGLRNEGKFTAAMERVNVFYSTYLKTGTADVLNRSVEDILMHFNGDSKALDPLSAVLSEEAELLSEAGREAEAAQRGLKALSILEYLDAADLHTYSQDRKARLDKLKLKYNT